MECNASYNFTVINCDRSYVEFQPYDLRHACAIRAHLQGISIKAAADNLGHTVDEHTKTYQRWFGIENRKKAFGEVFIGGQLGQVILVVWKFPPYLKPGQIELWRWQEFWFKVFSAIA
jgi:hypothetical protein